MHPNYASDEDSPYNLPSMLPQDSGGSDEGDADAGLNPLTSQTLNADGTPKRPMNAFMIFARRRRPQVSAENQSMRTGDISKILSQEWKAMLPADKQFYLTQAKQLKESFNNKYPDYVYRRRPNNTRKRRKSDSTSSGPTRGDTDDDHSSPDAEDSGAGVDLPLPDHGRYHPQSPYDRYPSSSSSSHSHSPYGFNSSSGPYGGSSYGHGHGHGHGHVRSGSYPYPPSSSSSNTDVYRTTYDSSRAAQQLYYPPFDVNSNGTGSPGLGLRKAQSIPSMPSGHGQLSPPLAHLNSHPSQPSHSHSHSHSTSSSSTYSNPTSSASSPHSSYFPGSSTTPHPATYSPPTRYSPYSSSTSASGASASPVPTAYSPFATSSSGTSGSTASASPAPYTAANAGSPGSYANGPGSGSPPLPHSHSSYGSAPRSLTNGLGLIGSGGLLGSSGLGGSVGVGADDGFYWRASAGAGTADKLL